MSNILGLHKLKNGYKGKLKIYNKSYENVPIETPKDKTIVYLDPPYKNTHQYQNKLDYDKFIRWIKDSKYRIVMSGYDMPFREISSFNTFSSMDAKTKKKVKEKLFTNI